MGTRRDFLKTMVGAVALATLARRAEAEAPPVGLQLYTVRQETRDLPGLLKKIRQIGYEEVETYWNLYSHPAPELRKMISDAGLRVPSGHFDYEKVEQSFDYAHQLGLQYMVCPMLPDKMQNTTLDSFKKAAAQFNRWGERAQKAGFRFAFHNHNYEFQKFGNTDGFDTLVKETDPKLVFFEMDCYWVTQAGSDPVQLMNALGKRVRLLHIKDRVAGFPTSQKLGDEAEHFTEVGTGTIDYKRIVAAAKAIGVEHYFVEQDHLYKPAFESLEISFKNAQRLLA